MAVDSDGVHRVLCCLTRQTRLGVCQRKNDGGWRHTHQTLTIRVGLTGLDTFTRE